MLSCLNMASCALKVVVTRYKTHFTSNFVESKPGPFFAGQ